MSHTMMSINDYIKKYSHLFEVSPTYKARELSVKYGFLDYMIERYMNMFYDEELEDFLYHCSVPIRKSIRCNDLLINCNDLVNRLEDKGFKLEKVSWLPHGYRVINFPKSPSLGATIEYLSGYYYIQGVASMVPPYVLSPTEKDIVLDMAAAPGSKTTQLSQLMRNKGVILAVEKSRERARKLFSNLNRMGATNVIILRSDVKVLSKTSLRFTKILLDAPCSGEGLIPIDPSRRTKTTLQDLKNFSVLQLELITIASELLEDRGILVYSTCSIAPEEDEFIVNYALEYLGLESIPITGYPAEKGIEEFRGIKFNSGVKNCIRFYPHKNGTEGFFVCMMRKHDN